MNKKSANFIFDLDGTLIDSAQQIGDCLNKARLEFGFIPLPTSEINKMFGIPIKYFLSDLQLPPNIEEVVIIKFRLLLSQAIELENNVYPGVTELLSELKKRGHTVSIATSKPTFLANKVVQNSDLQYFVDFTQGTDNFPAKPQPDVIIKVINLARGQRSLMIGDRVEDVKAAIAAGIPCIGVAHSYHSMNLLSNSGAALVYDKISHIYSSLDLVETLIKE